MMNRESSIHSSDTLVVVDRSRQRRMLLIGAAVLVAILAVVLALTMGRDAGETAASKGAAAEKGGRAGQLAAVSVIVPGRTQVASVVTASGPLAARRDQPVGVAGGGGKVVRVLVDAGSWVRQGQVMAVIDRAVQAQQAAQLAAQVDAARAEAALAQSNYERALALQGRGFVSKAEIDSKRATRDAANARVRVAQAQLGATRAEIGRLAVTAPTSGPA
jgi:multidrug efflux pump subunit AcrA (membrane-fusion protein)